MKEHCEINLKYHTIQAYQNIMKNHIKPKLGFYMLSQLTTSVLQEFINNIYLEKGFSKNFLKNILKVLKGSLGYATDVVGFIKVNPSLKVRLPKYDIPDSDPVYILSNEEVEKILERFSNNRCVYYAFLTAYYTGLRISEVFGLTWDDIDFAKKTITVNKNILKKNQAGGTKNRLISGNSTTVWYFGTCKTKGSYRTIEIGDTLLNALKQYKEEQIQNRKDYGDTYMKHYKKIVNNPYNNKPEIKIINAYANIRKVLYMLLSCGLAEVLSFVLAILFDLPMPLVAVQLLWLNIVTDGLQDLALSFEKEKLLDRKNSNNIFDKQMIEQILISGLFMGIISFIVFVVLIKCFDMQVSTARGYVMALMVFMQNMHVLNCRSEYLSVFNNPIKNNIFVLFSIVSAIILQIIVMEVDMFSMFLQTTSIPFIHLIFLFLASLPILLVMEMYKEIKKKKN